MKPTLVTLALALALPGVSFADEGPKRASKPDLRADVPSYDLTTKVFYAPSGLTVMFQEDHSHPIVSIMSIVNHGSGDDPPGKEETAHFVEHTWFRSTQDVSLKWDENGNPITTTLPSIMDVLQDYGTLFNATTRNDWTDYRTVFASEHLDLFLQLESNRLTTPYVGVTADQIAVEREVIANEWRRRNDQGMSRLFDYIYEAVYPESHPYHSTSTKETLARVDLPTLQTYFDSYYKPENTTIMVVGDLNINEASSYIFKNFDLEVIDPALKPEHLFVYRAPGVSAAEADKTNPAHWRVGAYDPKTFDPSKGSDQQDLYDGFLNPEDPADAEALAARVRIKPGSGEGTVPEPGSKGLVEREAPIDNRVVMAAWSLPGAFREDHAKIEMVGNLANYALQLWFNPNNYRMAEEDWKPSDIAGGNCFVQTEKINSTLMCLVEVKNAKLDPESLAEKIIDQMPTIWNPDFVMTLEQQAFPRARQENLSGLLKSIDNVAYHFGGRAEDIVTYAHYTGSPTYHSSAMNRAVELNALDVAALAEKYLTRKRAVKIVVDPLPKSKIDTTGEGSGYAGSSDADVLLEPSEEAKAITEKTIKDAFVVPSLEGLVDEKLPNGLRVIVLPHGDAPVAYTTLVFGGGSRTGEKGKMSFMNAFTTTEDGEDPLQIAGEWAGDWLASNSYFGMRHAAGNVDGALWMLREEVESIKPDLAYKKDYLTDRRKRLTGGWSSRSAGWLIAEAESLHLYGGDPMWSPTTWEEIDALGALGVSDVATMAANVYQPANATLIITGQIPDPAKALEDAKTYFGGWKPRPGASSDIDALSVVKTPPMTEGSKILVFDDPKRTQTQVDGGCRLNYTGPADKPSVDVLSSIIGNEIFTKIRVKESLAYSPGGYAYVQPGNVAALGFSSLSVNDGAGRTVEIMKELVETAEAGGIDGDTVKIHKLREARSRGLEAQSTDQISARLRQVAVDKLPVEDLTKYGERVADVNPEVMKTLTAGCSDRLLFTMSGPAAVITPQLDKLGYEYEVVDWKAEGEARFAKYDPKGFKKYQKAKAKAAAKGTEEAPAEGEAPAPPPAAPTEAPAPEATPTE